MKQTEEQITSLYVRLSRDDENADDSNSIVNQKKYLESYAQQRGYTNCRHYTDDGWSGGNFERPAWKQLIADIEAGKVVVTDMDKTVEFYKSVLGLEVVMDFGANKTLTGGLALQTLETYKEFMSDQIPGCTALRFPRSPDCTDNRKPHH